MASKVKLKKPLPVKGFVLGGVTSGVKEKKNAKDLGALLSLVPCTVAGVFTKNKVKAAPLIVGMELIKKSSIRGVIVNSGYANAFTGKQGILDCDSVLENAEAAFDLKTNSLMPGSTGKIGGLIPLKKINSNLDKLYKNLNSDGAVDFATAITTTDTFSKYASRSFKAGSKTITISGVSKGSGMIRPNMATMLGYIYTDAKVGKALLKKALKEIVGDSFNCISVDNDESTNDTVLLFANGESKAPELKEGSVSYKKFLKELKSLAIELAQLIVRDGEGATKFIELIVKGTASQKDADNAVWAVADSMLCKTAFFGKDPNWGRIVAAIGKSSAKFNPDKINLSIGGVPILVNGIYTGKERLAGVKMKKCDITVVIDLKNGKFSKTVWTTDLSYGYVRINAEYRT